MAVTNNGPMITANGMDELARLKAMLAEKEAELAAKDAIIAASKAEKAKAMTLKVSPESGVLVIGFGGGFPISLYKDRMIQVLDAADEIRAFINGPAGALLSTGKDDDRYAAHRAKSKAETAAKRAAYQASRPSAVTVKA